MNLVIKRMFWFINVLYTVPYGKICLLRTILQAYARVHTHVAFCIGFLIHWPHRGVLKIIIKRVKKEDNPSLMSATSIIQCLAFIFPLKVALIGFYKRIFRFFLHFKFNSSFYSSLVLVKWKYVLGIIILTLNSKTINYIRFTYIALMPRTEIWTLWFAVNKYIFKDKLNQVHNLSGWEFGSRFGLSILQFIFINRIWIFFYF